MQKVVSDLAELADAVGTLPETARLSLEPTPSGMRIITRQHYGHRLAEAEAWLSWELIDDARINPWLYALEQCRRKLDELAAKATERAWDRRA